MNTTPAGEAKPGVAIFPWWGDWWGAHLSPWVLEDGAGVRGCWLWDFGEEDVQMLLG